MERRFKKFSDTELLQLKEEITSEKFREEIEEEIAIRCFNKIRLKHFLQTECKPIIHLDLEENNQKIFREKKEK